MRRVVLALILFAATPTMAQEPIYYAYVSYGALDVNGKAVIDPATNEQIDSGFCLVWRPHWKTDDADIEILNGNFYSKVSYRITQVKDGYHLVLYQVEAPRVVAINDGTGWFPIGLDADGHDIDFQVNVDVPMSLMPQDDWPCSKETWDAIVSMPEREDAPVQIVLPGAGGGVHHQPSHPQSPRGPAVCKMPNWPGFRC